MAVETTKASPHHSGHGLSALSLAALGVVYGDIGTSPLYTLKVVLVPRAIILHRRPSLARCR